MTILPGMGALNGFMSGAASTALRSYSVPADVFASNAYTGAGTATVTSGVAADLVWVKSRSVAASSHRVVRNKVAPAFIESNSTSAEVIYGAFSFNSTGWAYSGNNGFISLSGETYASWSFATAMKFLDIQTFTSGSSTNRRISHGLTVVPGMILIKSTSATEQWLVYHVSQGISSYGNLNTNVAFTSSVSAWGTVPTTTDFGINETILGGVGRNYVAYVFAHDPSGIIQTGSFTTDGSGNATVALGWQPQFLFYKNPSAAEDWFLLDTTRGWNGTSDLTLSANSTNIEANSGGVISAPTSTGFSTVGLTASSTYVYMTIKA